MAAAPVTKQRYFMRLTPRLKWKKKAEASTKKPTNWNPSLSWVKVQTRLFIHSKSVIIFEASAKVRLKGLHAYVKMFIVWNNGTLQCQNIILYFIEFNAQMSMVRTWISQWFFAKKLFLFFKNNFTRINHCMFIQHKSHLKPFLSYLPCTVCREYFSIIFNVKKCALYSIKYGTNRIGNPN